MTITRETILADLHARLQPLAALVQRDEVLPERIPPAGLIIKTVYTGPNDTTLCFVGPNPKKTCFVAEEDSAF